MLVHVGLRKKGPAGRGWWQLAQCTQVDEPVGVEDGAAAIGPVDDDGGDGD